MPSSRKRPCAIVIVVFATITEGTLASSGTRPRRSHALTASPPSAAVGVARLKASPASRTPRRNAKRQPSVSNTMISTTGKQSTIASRQESWTIKARIAAGSFVATRTASRPTPRTSSAARTERRSALPIEDQQDTDRGERAGPEPPGNPSLGRREPELEPSAPADEHPEEAERRVGHLRQELFLEPEARVRVRQEEAPADRADERKDERRLPGAQAPRADHPLEDREDDDQQDEHAVLEHSGIRPALPEPQRPEGPGAGVVADRQEGGEPEEDQRPVARPARAAGRVDDREQPHGEHEQPGDVVVELGPRAVRGGPRGVTIVHGQRLDRRRRERRPLGGEPRDDLGERRAVRDHVDRGRERGQRRRDEQGREAEPELDLDEPTEPRGADVGLRREPAHRDEVHRAEEQEGGEDRHLGEHHHAVRGPEQREDAADEREREREAAGHEDPDRRERERREASEQERRPQALAPPEPRDDEVREAADPRRCRELVDAIERQ